MLSITGSRILLPPAAEAGKRPAEAQKKTDDAAKDTAAAGPQLLVSHRKQHIAAWPLSAGRFTIGRAIDNNLRLEAQFISRHHCQVVTSGDVSTIEDLGSVNGIIVNGRVVKKHRLQHADRIILGEHVLTYVVG